MSPDVRSLLTLVVASVAVLAGCATGSGSTTAADGTTDGTTGGTTRGTGPSMTTTTVAADRASAASMRGDRYCEVLLVDVVDGEATAEVFVSYPLNDCPAERWDALDAAAVAAVEGTTTAVLNGPRYWLVDEVEKERSEAAPDTRAFGGIEMRRQASVQIGSLAGAGQPYVVREVDRSTVFTFGAGRSVYELRAPDGSTYVMQSWSQQKDPVLAESDLAGLGSRLQLPSGWTYATRVLDAPLVVDTTTTTAKVLQDELANSYSYVAT